VGWILAGFDGPLFGHPLIQSGQTANVPVAYLDWSRGTTPPRPGDLAVLPDLKLDQLADQVVSWIGRT
jgi:hypothetical protein